MSLGIYLWIVLPYVCLAIFAAGHVWRYRRDQFGWTTRSTQLLESRWLAWGSNLFHWGALLAIGGHIIGIAIPNFLVGALGVSEMYYHVLSVSAGTLAGLPCLAGLVILIGRRLLVRRVRVTTSYMDVVMYVLLSVEIVLGMGQTVGINLFGGGYDYRSTEAVWFRGIFWLHPEPGLIEGAPLLYQAHAAVAWLIYAVWPFTRLVHVWSIPLQYIGRPYILYRSRYAPTR